MGLLDLFRKKDDEVYEQVYCQNCYKDITFEGGDVSNSGRIYCHGYKADGESRCLDEEMRLVMKGAIKTGVVKCTYLSAGQVQLAIKKKQLINCGKLEKEIISK